MSWNSSSGSLIWQVMNFLAPEDGRFGFNYASCDLYFICTSKLFKRICFNHNLGFSDVDSTNITNFCGMKVIVNDDFHFGINNDYQIVFKEEYDLGNIEHIWIHGDYSYI